MTYINFDYTYIDSRETTKDNNLEFKFSDDLTKKGFWGGTVVYFSLQIAYFLGFKKYTYLVLTYHTKYQNPLK